MARRVRVFLRDTQPSRSAPTDTGVAFLATIPLKGALDVNRPIKSLDQLERVHGARQSFSVCWDWCETFFREEGHTLYLSPVRGPAAAKATANIAGAVGTTLVVNAKSVGEWANGAAGGLTYEVIAGPSGGTFRVIIIRANAIEVERTPEFSATTDAVAWSATSEYVDFVLGGGSGQPNVVAATNLTGGTLDRASITQTQVDQALALMVRDLGPGQVASPDWWTTAAHTSLLAHAAAMNRYALPDAPDLASKSSLLTLGNAIQGNVNGSYGDAVLGTWLNIQGVAGGATRAVPLSAFVAAKCAQTDATEGPAQAPAGKFGQATSALVLGVRWPGGTPFTDVDQADLETAGVAVAVSQFGTVTFDTNRTLVEPLGTEKEWLQTGVARYRMALVAKAEAAGGPFAHRKITQRTIAELDTALTGIMMLDEQNDWLLLLPGEQPGSAFAVETGEPVNTPETIAAQELIAAVGFRPAPGADFVNIYLTAVAPTDTVAA